MIDEVVATVERWPELAQAAGVREVVSVRGFLGGWLGLRFRVNGQTVGKNKNEKQPAAP